MKKAGLKFVGDAIPDALKCGGEASGILLVSPT